MTPETGAGGLAHLLKAAQNADWQQVVLNGGPPCFHFESERGKFCLRAERWPGHGKAHHAFVSLADLLAALRAAATPPKEKD